MLLRLLNTQGIAGLAASFALLGLLLLEKGETRHWRKQSSQFEQLYGSEQSAFTGTVANYRAAADKARAADRAAAERAQSEQRAISERTNNAFQDRLAAARARAELLRLEASAAPVDPSAGRAAPMPGLSLAATGPHQTASQDGFSPADRLIATEQAIQLDELIKWVRQQHALEPS